MNNKKIFIACPISKYLTDDGIDKDFEIFIKEVFSICKEKSDNVFLALEREEYGKKKMYGSDCTTADYEEMKDTNILIAFPEDSMGVAVEMGWASALGKDILVFVDKKYKQSELVKSINSVANGMRSEIDTTNGYTKELEKIRDVIFEFLNN